MSPWILALALFSTDATVPFDRLVAPAEVDAVADALAEDLRLQEARLAVARAYYSGTVTTFDLSWLRLGKWEAVGIVERPDRRLNRPDLCGETRLLYRLRHQGKALPAMINVVYEWRTTEPCAEFWRHRPSLGVDWSRLEINLQTARWADDGKGSFVDQVRYVLRAFRKEGGALLVAPLENMPDVARIQADPKLKSELSLWLSQPDTVAATLRGFPQLPEKFLATSAESVTPFGLGRLANRPFLALFQDGDWPESLLRRLDTLTCVGCHQSAAVAGFHFLGRTKAADGPSLAEPFSAYFAAIQDWRRSDLEEPLPDPERLVRPDAGTGDREEPPVPVKDGDACEALRLNTSWLPEADTQSDVRLGLCPQGGVCASTTNGFPGGMCSSPCTDHSPGMRCQAVPTLGPFSVCRDDGGTFEACLAAHHQVTALASCGAPGDCRADYACIVAPSGGYCAPAYILPHLNIQHH